MADDDTSGEGTGGGRSPLERLDALAMQDVEVAPGLAHLEVYTLRGLLTLLWHGPRDAEQVLLLCGGAMGGLLGPGRGLYHELGAHFAEAGIGTIRVSYRRPNDLELCTHDLIAAADLAARSGGRDFITMGHSFGGAIAVRAGIMLGDHARGVVTFATQSAGCEVADQLPPTPLLLFHGDRDELLPPMASEVVAGLAGGRLEMLPGVGHLMDQAHDILADELRAWVPDRFASDPHTATTRQTTDPDQEARP